VAPRRPLSPAPLKLNRKQDSENRVQVSALTPDAWSLKPAGRRKLDILAIYGSPRKNGNTDALLDSFISGAQDEGAAVERVYARELDIHCCIECRQCEKAGRCVVEDDMQEIYPLLESVRAVALASPIFFYSVTACVKPLIDRAEALWARKYVLKNPVPAAVDGVERLGYFLSCGATKGENLFEGALLTMKYFFDATGVRLAESLTYRRIENAGDIRRHPQALREAAELGRTAARRVLGKGD
jgi:multimeric flavodoxin WrbA